MHFYISTSSFFLKPSAFTFSHLSSFSLIRTTLSGFWKELKVPPSARRHHSQVIVRTMMNPLRLPNTFMGFHIRKERLRCISPRYKNRLTNPKHLITKNAAFYSKKYNSVPQFRWVFLDYLNDCRQVTSNNFALLQAQM